MPVRKVTVTEEFEAAVEAFRQQRGIKHWSVALLQLAATGYEEETGELPPQANVAPGGWRGKEASIEALMRYANVEMKCGYCGHKQHVRTWDSECRNCGECEFVEI